MRNRDERLNELIRDADHIQLSIEEMLATLGEDYRLGDDGVAELIISLENTSALLQAKLKKRRQ